MYKFCKNNYLKNSIMNSQNQNSIKENDTHSDSEESMMKMEEITNTRKLTVVPAVNTSNSSSSHDIDKQINDLETLIKRLQDEIINMSNDVEQPVENEPLEEPEASPHHLRMKIDDSENDPNRNRHIYSVIINDGGLRSSATKPLSDFKISEPIDTPSTAELEEAFSNIRRDFSLLWDDVEDVPTQKKEEMDHVEENMKETLSDLKSKISEIINYQESHFPLNNSKEKFE